MTAPKPKKRGPKPDVLKIEGDVGSAVDKLFQAKPVAQKTDKRGTDSPPRKSGAS